MTTISSKPKVLLLDIETAPLQAYVWGMWKNDIYSDQLISDWYCLCWVAKWLGKPKIYWSSSQHLDGEDDKWTMETLWSLLDEADVVIAHNGKRFDIPKINTRFLVNGIGPPSPYKQIDTLTAARGAFGFSSNRLDFLAQALGLGAKLKTSFDLWSGCLAGEAQSWKKMVRYNKHDVKLLEEVYLKMRPWIKSHPNLGIHTPLVTPTCPRCGSRELVKNGTVRTNASVFQQYVCKECGGYSRDRVSTLTKEQRANLRQAVA